MPALPSVITRLLRPEPGRPVPRPAQVDLRSMLFVGTGAWTVALVVFAVLEVVSDRAFGDQVAVCVAGLVLAGAGFVWEHAHRGQYRPLPARPATDDPDAAPAGEDGAAAQ